MTVLQFPWRRPPLIECPDCGRLMSDIQQHGVVLERFCAACKVTHTNRRRGRHAGHGRGVLSRCLHSLRARYDALREAPGEQGSRNAPPLAQEERPSALHAPGIETLNLLCGDQFYRDHWRATCSCGWHGPLNFWRSGVGEDFALHVIKAAEGQSA